MRCIKPWTSMFIKDNEVRVCCWAKQALAELKPNTSLLDFWNNELSQYVRRKMLKGETADICPDICPILHSQSDNFTHFQSCQAAFSENEKRIYEHIKNGDTMIESKPYDIGVVIDHACNLRCKMCFIFENHGYVTCDSFYKIVDEIHASLRHIYLIGGEPFFSPKSLQFINDCLKKNYKFKFGFVTNLTIFDHELLSKIRIDGFCVSIDGATKETYEKIRRGANWESVMDNLKSLIQLEKESAEHFVIKVAFVVMSSNFREIPLAIELFEPLGVQLEFPPIITIPGDEENIFEQEELYEDFRRVIETARKKTKQEMVLNSLNVLQGILEKYLPQAASPRLEA